MTTIPPFAQIIIDAWPEQPSEAAKQKLIDWLKAGIANQQQDVHFEQDGQRGACATFEQDGQRWTVGITRRRGQRQSGSYWKIFVIEPKTHVPDPDTMAFVARSLAGVK